MANTSVPGSRSFERSTLAAKTMPIQKDSKESSRLGKSRQRRSNGLDCRVLNGLRSLSSRLTSLSTDEAAVEDEVVEVEVAAEEVTAVEAAAAVVEVVTDNVHVHAVRGYYHRR